MATLFFLIPSSGSKTDQKEIMMDKKKWWNVFTDKLAELLDIECSDMQYLGYLDAEDDRMQGLTPTESVQSLEDFFGKKHLKSVVTKGYMGDTKDVPKDIELYYKKNPNISTRAYFEKHGII